MRRKKIWALVACVLLLAQVGIYAAVDTDQSIQSAPVDNVYEGRDTAQALIRNIQFQDVAANSWAAKAIARMGALEVVKGYNTNGAYRFRPNANVSNQEALAFILRALGMEDEAKTAAEAVQGAPDDGTLTLWSKGYLTIANQMGLITGAQLADALIPDQTLLDPEFNFMREDPVTREQLAMWLVQGMNAQDPNSIAPLYRQQSVLNYGDWQSIGAEFVPYVEAVSAAKIMNGDGSNFNPTSPLTRAELVQTIANLGDRLYDAMGLTLKSGYVGHMERAITRQTTTGTWTDTALIRRDDGGVDQLVRSTNSNALGQVTVNEIVVYDSGKVGTMNNLSEGDVVQYLVDDATGTVYYVEVEGGYSVSYQTGQLEPLSDVQNGRITITNELGQKETFYLSSGVYRASTNEILIGGTWVPLANAPVTNPVTIEKTGNVVTAIDFSEGQDTGMEISGLVIENNTDYHYLRVEDWNGNQVTKYYRDNDMTVEKQAYYDSEDQIGYLDELFPVYAMDEDDTTMATIEAGDIIHIRLDPDNTDYIIMARAKTNYTVKYGEVETVRDRGDAGVTMTVTMSDGSVATYPVAEDVPVIKGTINKRVLDIGAGDIVRLLVNQSVASPGSIRETVKEVSIDPYGNSVNTIYKGELGAVNKGQQTMTMLNGFELLQTGWRSYSPAMSMDISGKDIQYYYGSKPITLEYADKYLRSEGTDMYIVTENYHNSERVTKVAFRDGRDSVIAYNNVTTTNGVSQVEVQNHSQSIALDEGTIVVKNGKMVSPSNIMAPDYAQIVLNGNNQAAVLRIEPEPNNESISIMRGRIAKIDEYEDFTVQSYAQLTQNRWIYSPIERVFEMDYRTVIKEGEETLGFDEFIGYSEATKVDKVYTVIANGTKATHVVSMPYTTEAIKGEIYDVAADGSTLSLKDTMTYSKSTKEWKALSYTNSYAMADIQQESIVIKNNQVIDVDQLRIGDTVRIMTTVDLGEELKLNDTRNVPAYIMIVE